LYFLVRLRTFASRAISNLAAFPASQPLAGTRVAPKSSNSAFKARIVQSVLCSF